MITPSFDHWPYPFWIGHRGAGKQAPENTLAAFRLGAGHGYQAFECDVKLSSDSVPFLLHDDTLDRTTNGHGVAGQRPWADLSRLDAGSWHSPTYAGESVLTLEALARWLLANRLMVNLEIKPTTGLAFETGRVVARETARLWNDVGANSAAPAAATTASRSNASIDAAIAPVVPLLTSFQPDALAGAQETAPELPRGLLLDKLHDGWLDTARSLQCVAVVASFRLLDASVIAVIHDNGMRALSYTVNTEQEVSRLKAAGIDGVITDETGRFRPGA